jgi:hypothetical protein
VSVCLFVCLSVRVSDMWSVDKDDDASAQAEGQSQSVEVAAAATIACPVLESVLKVEAAVGRSEAARRARARSSLAAQRGGRKQGLGRPGKRRDAKAGHPPPFFELANHSQTVSGCALPSLL